MARHFPLVEISSRTGDADFFLKLFLCLKVPKAAARLKDRMMTVQM
jgi:hypothetical protein